MNNLDIKFPKSGPLKIAIIQLFLIIVDYSLFILLIQLSSLSNNNFDFELYFSTVDEYDFRGYLLFFLIRLTFYFPTQLFLFFGFVTMVSKMPTLIKYVLLYSLNYTIVTFLLALLVPEWLFPSIFNENLYLTIPLSFLMPLMIYKIPFFKGI